MSLAAKISWRKIETPVSPSPRYAHVFNSVHYSYKGRYIDELVLMWGGGDERLCKDIWVFDLGLMIDSRRK
jgi:hypothetical protein